MIPFLIPLLLQGLGLLLPGLSPSIASALAGAMPKVVDLVDELADKDLPGSKKRELVIEDVGALLDKALDDVPAWGALAEEKRDRMLTGLVEWAVFLSSLTDRKSRRKLRRALRHV